MPNLSPKFGVHATVNACVITGRIAVKLMCRMGNTTDSDSLINVDAGTL